MNMTQLQALLDQMKVDSGSTTNTQAANSGGMSFGQGASAAVGAIGTLGGLYLGAKNLGLAKKSFAFNKKVAGANYTNQAKSYNDRVEWRQRNTLNGKGSTEGRRISDREMDEYLAADRQKDRTVRETL